MRVSLQIDGDAKGAEQAAQDTSRAIGDLGKQTEAISQAIQDGFKGAIDQIDKMKNASQAAGAANDNTAGAALGLASKLSQVAAQAAGAESALAKTAAGAVNIAKGIGDAVKAVGAFNVVGAIIGVATTAVQTFYSIANQGASTVEKNLDEHARLIGVVRDAYKDAAKTAGEFLNESRNVTLFQLQQNAVALKAERDKAARGVVSGFNYDATIAAITNQNNLGVGGASGSSNDAEVKNIQELKGAVDAFAASLAAGGADSEKLRERIALIGLAAQGTNPALAELVANVLKSSASVEDYNKKLKENSAAQAGARGDADALQKKVFGAATAANQAGNEFDRLTKSMSRQAAAQEAEAASAGKSAGEAARLRAEFILTEAAQQSGISTAGAYGAKIKEIADRFGEATQKAAQARLESSLAFDASQLGRSSIDATVADRLRGAGFGDDVGKELNSANGNAIRLVETMKELKSTTSEIASGAFREFRSEIQSGTNALEALGKVGVNALNKIIDKLADKAFDKFISSALGSVGSLLGIGGSGTVANGGIVLGGADGPGVFAAAGGGTFGPGWGVVGEEGAELIKVHNGGVTVFPHHISKPYLPGFAEGGSLSAWGSVARLPGAGQDNGQGGSQQAVHVTVGVTVDDDGKLKAYVKNVSAQATNDGIAGYAASSAFVAHVADASNAAKTYRML